MIRVRIKNGVSLDNCHPAVFTIISVAAPIWAKFGAADLWITGGNEPGHSTGARGFHRLPDGTCQAVDLRTWSIPDSVDRRLAPRALAKALGLAYDVLYEEEQRDPTTGIVLRGEHVHCQFDPDRPGTVA